jgi:trafficking protein particle complex subunit 13
LDPKDTSRAIHEIKIQGDMQTPSAPSGSPLELFGLDSQESQAEDEASPAPGESLQKILKFELKEEGNHVLAVTVTYTETALGDDKASGGRVRTFRKLYQFVAQQLLSVRTKAGELKNKEGSKKYLLEAQLENMGDGPVSFEVCLRPSFTSPT